MSLSKNEKKWHLLKSDKNIQVYCATLDNQQQVLVKQYRLDSWLDRLSFRIKVKKLAAFYQQGFTFVPAMLHAVVREKGRLGQLCYDYIDGQDLRSIEWDTISTEHLQLMGCAIGKLLAQLHSAGWAHGDCKFGNFIYVLPLENENLARENCIKLVDVEAAKRPVLHKQKAQARDIARLLLNSLERKVPTIFVETMWKSYTEIAKPADIEAIKADIRYWLLKLAARHQTKYGTAIDCGGVDFLSGKN